MQGSGTRNYANGAQGDGDYGWMSEAMERETISKQIEGKRFQVQGDLLSDSAVVVSGFGTYPNQFSVCISAAIVAAVGGVEVVLRGGMNTNIGCNFAPLAQLGVEITSDSDALQSNLDKYGVVFLDEGDMEDDTATVLANPLNAQRRLVALPNVTQESLAEYAQIVKDGGGTSSMVCGGASGLPAVDISGRTHLYQITPTMLKRRNISSADFGLPDNERALLSIKNLLDDVNSIVKVMDGDGVTQNAPADHDRAICCATLLQSALIMLVAGKAVSLQHGAELSKDVLLDGTAKEKLPDLASAI